MTLDNHFLMKTQYQPMPAIQYIGLNCLMGNAEFLIERLLLSDSRTATETAGLSASALSSHHPSSLSTGYTRVLVSLVFSASWWVE